MTNSVLFSIMLAIIQINSFEMYPAVWDCYLYARCSGATHLTEKLKTLIYIDMIKLLFFMLQNIYV